MQPFRPAAADGPDHAIEHRCEGSPFSVQLRSRQQTKQQQRAATSSPLRSQRRAQAKESRAPSSDAQGVATSLMFPPTPLLRSPRPLRVPPRALSAPVCSSAACLFRMRHSSASSPPRVGVNAAAMAWSLLPAASGDAVAMPRARSSPRRLVKAPSSACVSSFQTHSLHQQRRRAQW